VGEILSRILKKSDLEAIEKMAEVKRRSVGIKYESYLRRVAEVLKLKHAGTVAGIGTDELNRIIAVVDIIGIESHGLMKRLAAACPGCGWCCSQTVAIHVVAADVERLSRQLKKKKEDLFSYDGREWFIKKAQPCQWWNPRNGRCTIYNIRPRTCRDWPLAENREHVHTLVAAADCHYSVSVLVYKVLGALSVAAETQGDTPARVTSPDA